MKEGSHTLIRAPVFYFFTGKEKHICLRQGECSGI